MKFLLAALLCSGHVCLAQNQEEDTRAALAKLQALYKDGLLSEPAYETAQAAAVQHLTGAPSAEPEPEPQLDNHPEPGNGGGEVGAQGVYCCGFGGSECGDENDNLELEEFSIEIEKDEHHEDEFDIDVKGTGEDGDEYACSSEGIKIEHGKFALPSCGGLNFTDITYNQHNNKLTLTIDKLEHEHGEGEVAHVELGHCEHEEGVEEEVTDLPIFLDVLCLTVIGLVLLTIFFEKAKDFLEEYAGEDIKQLIQHLFGELTILGFIGLTSFLAVKFGLAKDLSVWIFVSPSKECEGGHGHEEATTHLLGPESLLERATWSLHTDYDPHGGGEEHEECMASHEYEERAELFTGKQSENGQLPCSPFQ